MSYNTIVNLALSYSDREDDETVQRIDDFLRIVEARVNRSIRVGRMSIRATLALSTLGEYYALPPDFAGLRDIEIYSATNGDVKSSLKYVSPEQMNKLTRVGGTLAEVYYTIIAGQIQIYPDRLDHILEIVYYQRLIPLTENDPDNWLSSFNLDAYVFGLLVEINSFVKDKESALLWDARFKEAIDSIINEDSMERWSGTALEVRIG